MNCERQEEEKILTICKERFYKEAVKDVFVLTYDRMRRYEGEWHPERKLLFPGHIFLEGKNEESVSEEMQKCSDIAWIKYDMNPVGRREEEFLKKLCKEGHHLEMSRGIICKGKARITEGPLKGLESRIHRIDRHKRLARVDIEGIPNYRYMTVGLEITEKIE